MEATKQWLTCREVKEWDMVDYLSKLGHEPTKIRNENYWYLSPLRNENTASFKVSRSRNRWYDFGLGKGGNLIDFGILYFRCSVAELLQKLSGDFSFQQPAIYIKRVIRESPINIIEESVITSKSLLDYLRQRKIAIKIALQYCREMRFRNGDKTYYAIGFKNDSGGFELRNTFIKAAPPRRI